MGAWVKTPSVALTVGVPPALIARMRRAGGRLRRRTASRAHGRVASGAVLAMIVCAGPALAVESSVLVSPSAMPGAEMAYAVSVDGTGVAIGTPGEDDIAGAAYSVDCTTLPCSTPLRVAPVDIVAGDAFGTATSLSADTLAVTAPGPEPGAVYVYIRDGAGWTQQARLTPSGGSSGERFGIAAALSGDLLAVGADQAANGAGAVYVFARSGTAWSQEARIVASDGNSDDMFGTSVSLDADTLLVGAPFKETPVAGSYANGAAYVFARSGTSWSQQAILTPTARVDGDLFGFAVAVAGDRAVVGAPYAAATKGRAYVFERTAGAWSQQTELAAAAGNLGDEFGWSVALGDDRILVGAPFSGQAAGAACGTSYLFDGTTFAQGPGASIEAPFPNELAGWSIASSGPRWVMSAPAHVVDANDHAGAAYWFDSLITVFHSGFDAAGACTAG
jgi:FG-GAP repeat